MKRGIEPSPIEHLYFVISTPSRDQVLRASMQGQAGLSDSVSPLSAQAQRAEAACQKPHSFKNVHGAESMSQLAKYLPYKHKAYHGYPVPWLK